MTPKFEYEWDDDYKFNVPKKSIFEYFHFVAIENWKKSFRSSDTKRDDLLA